MIPKILHQIWLGEKQMPEEWMETWCTKNPDFAYYFWDYDAIKLFGLKNDKVFENFMATKEYHGACDVARVEIVERIGGVYVDADSVCKKTISGAFFMDFDFFAVYDHETPGHPGRINNGVIGATAKHPILKEYSKRIGQAKEIRPPWSTIGGAMLTDCVREVAGKNITILPAYMFWPKNHDGKTVEILGENYAEQFWGTSLNLYKQKI